MGCRATGMSRRWDIAQLKWRANKISLKRMSRRWDVALEKSRANGISPFENKRKKWEKKEKRKKKEQSKI